MKRLICGILALAMAFTVVGCGTPVASQSRSESVQQEQLPEPPRSYKGVTIQWSQPQVEEAVRIALNKPTGDILGEELEAIQELDLSDANLWDADDFQYLLGLERLNLSGNHIHDLTPLRALTKLTSLELAHNDVDDLTSLSGMESLTHLDLAYNPISDLTPLSNLKKLEWLDCSNQKPNRNHSIWTALSLEDRDVLAQGLIQDITPLAELTHLKVLRLGGNPVASLTPLANLTALEELSLYGVRGREWNIFKDLANLRVLNLADNDLERIDFLSGLQQLESLDLSGNLIQTLKPLTTLPVLKQLHIKSCGLINRVEAFDPRLNELAELPALTHLWAGNEPSSFSGSERWTNDPGVLGWVERLPNLEELHLENSNTVFPDTFAASLPKLRVLNLSNSDIHNFDALRGMTSLKELYCDGWYCDRPADIAPLVDLPGLEKLAISWGGYGDFVPDTSPLSALTQLKELDLFTPNRQDLSFLRNMPNLEVLKIKQGTAENFQDFTGLKSLKVLTLNDVDINSLDGIEGCTALTELNLECFESDAPATLAPLASCKNLEKLFLVNQNTSDLSALTQLPALRDLHLHGYVNLVLAYAGYSVDGAVDPVSLGQIPTLETLQITGPAVSELSFLAALPRLQHLALTSSSLPEDLSALSRMTNLRKLELRAPLEDLTVLSTLTELRSLNVKNCGLASLTGIEGMSKLRQLDASENTLSNVDPLSTCSELAAVNLKSNELQQINSLSDKTKLRLLCFSPLQSTLLDQLAGLPLLNYLDCENTLLDDLSPLAQLPALKVLLMSCADDLDFLLPLSSCANLETLILDGFYDANVLSGLAGCPSLRYTNNFEAEKVLNGLVPIRG